MANLRTAATLFVVTAVFVVTFLPASLISLRVVPYHIFVFYLYFVNNVANPFIYSFMNKNFRDQLQPLFCRKTAERGSCPRIAHATARSRNHVNTRRTCCRRRCCCCAVVADQRNTNTHV